MKGGRLHRPDPPPPHAAAALAAPAPAPAPAPADDWVDGSWTVDCSCGVTFDDGEEMVSCDDCSVWVHTRCARYVRGVHTSFSCHNCRHKRAPSSADETEVAELLAELPTHRPPPLYRRWAEVPLPARVHVHGLPGGADASLFRGSPSSTAFSAALWRCAGYVPKKFGFRYCEFPSWAEDKDKRAEDKDGADALFAMARENREETAPAPAARLSLPIGNKGNKNAQTLSKKAEGSQHAGAKEVPPPTDAKTKGASKITAEADTRDNGFESKGDLNTPDIRHKDQFADITMANSDFKVVVEANKKRKESVELSGEKRSSEGTPRMLKKDEPKESIKLEISSGGRATSAVAEQEAHSRFVKAEVSICKKRIDGSHNVGLQSRIMDAEIDGGTRIHADSMEVHVGLQKQQNQASNLQVPASVLALPIQSKSKSIKRGVNFQDRERTKATQFIDDEHRSDNQGQGVSAGLIAQRSSAKSISDSGSDLLNSLTKSQMHTIPEQNSALGVQKVCTASSGPTSPHVEIPHSLVSAEPSSGGKTGRLMKKEQTRLVSPADSKHDSVKHSAESSKEFSRSSEKVQLKGSLSSAPKSSQTSKSYVPSAKHRVPVSKEQSQKTPMTAGTTARSFHGEVPPLHPRNKAMPSNLPQKKDKTHHRFVHVTQEGSTNSASTELRASDATASLSDEQLALLLHQQLNSSPRVPRVPRGHQTGSQMLHQTGASVFSKRSSAHGGRDQTPVLKKRNKDDVALRDNGDNKRSGKVSLVERRHKDYSTERTPSVKDSCRLADSAELEEQNHGMCSNEATTGLEKDDRMDSSLPHSLPGFIDEIISRNRNITYDELCDAIGEHWRDLVKPKGEDYSYSSFLHAVDDCLRTKSEWAHLVYQASKMNLNKRRKVESDPSSADVTETEKTRNQAERYPGEEGSSESQQGLPRGKRKGRKRSRHEMKSSSSKKRRKISNVDSSSEDAAPTLSNSSSNPMDDESQEDNSSGGDRQPNFAG
ncbi:PHD finger protein [Hordeum vulgare]|nr:PHD finger protein [Hordeum vulgare]